ncbi:uncharacterized protein DS421_8g239940 [Arachis hypogaea]|nr:uncharacterized protein DS421_8g239940 [Arachis hypogaea]
MVEGGFPPVLRDFSAITLYPDYFVDHCDVTDRSTELAVHHSLKHQLCDSFCYAHFCLLQLH